MSEKELKRKSDDNVASATDQESAVDQIQGFGAAPDGGLQAWLVAAGGGALFFCCLGFANSFGTFAEYYLSHQLQDRSADDIAWIGSLSIFLQFASGMVGGPLFDRYGTKVVRPAAVVYIFSIMMLSLCAAYWHFMLVQAVLMGTVMGFLQIPAFAAVSQYFDKKRAAALGIVVSGSSIGGIVTPILVSRMLNSSSLGFGWSIRIIGFIMVPFIAFASMTVKPRVPPRTTNFWISTAFKDLKFNLLVASMFFLFIGMFTPQFFIPVYAVSIGMSATQAGYLLAILNATSTFGRIIPGVLADKYGRLNIYAIGGFANAIVIYCMNSTSSQAGLIVYTAAFGFVSGSIISGASTALSVCVDDPRDIGTYMGMGLAISSLGALIGPPVNGVFIENYGGFFEVSMFSGSACLFGSFIAVAAKLGTLEGLLGRV